MSTTATSGGFTWRDLLGLRRGVTGLRAELRDALFQAAHIHTCMECPVHEDLLDAGYFEAHMIDLGDDYDLAELLDRLVEIAERGGRRG